MYRIVDDDLPPIPDVCSEEMRDFLMQCFKKDPADRPNAERLFEHPWLKQTLGEVRVSVSVFGWRVVILVRHGLIRSTTCLITGLAPSGQYPFSAAREP